MSESSILLIFRGALNDEPSITVGDGDQGDDWPTAG
jgi:hypothetical protein